MIQNANLETIDAAFINSFQGKLIIDKPINCYFDCVKQFISDDGIDSAFL